MKRNVILLNLFLVFLLGFSFIYACYVGLPYDFCADHPKNIRGVESMSYGELIRLVLDPRTPVWFYPPGARADLMAYVRPLQFLLIKIYYSLFGYSLPHIHMVAAVGCGLLMALLFLLIVYWTESALWGWLAVILYLSFPSNFFTLFTVAAEDSQFFLSLLTLSSLLLFGSLTSKKIRRRSFAARLAFWIVFIWLAIKLKSTEKILPVVCLTFLVWQFRAIRTMIGPRRMGVLFLAIAGMFVFIVPSRSTFHQFSQKMQRQDTARVSPNVAATTKKDQKALSLKWQNALKRTFYASKEKFSLESIYHRPISPLSFTENYGFPLGAFFWLGLFSTLLFWIILRTRDPLPEGLPHREFFLHFFRLFLVWFAAIFAGFSSGMDLTENRFLNFAYIPSIFLLFMMVAAFSKYLAISPITSRFFRILVVLLVLATALSNFINFAKLLGFYGGRSSALVRVEKDIFPFVYGKHSDERTLYDKHPDLEQRAVTVGWYDYPRDWTEIAQEQLKTERTVFLYLEAPDPQRLEKLRRNGFAVSFWKKYSFLDAEPLVFRLLKKIYLMRSPRITSPRTEVLVYKIDHVGG